MSEAQTTALGDISTVDPALREKYDVRGPRYTSYPPATHFAELPAERIAELWRERNGLADDPGMSLYFHVPFCRARCLFCACHTLTGGQATKIEGYVDSLIEEMKRVAQVIDPKRPVRQVAFGGGTPNYLTVEESDRLLTAMREIWNIQDTAEISAELDPRVATPEKLDNYLKHGFNRISLGIQDFAPEVIEKVRRGMDLMKVEEVIEYLRGKGVAQINFDFVYGLPKQTLETAKETARQAVAFRPTRIALYSYAHVPWLYKHQEALERAGLPETELKAQLFFAMTDIFTEAGYVAIGMDHFALPEDRLAQAFLAKTLRRNFMGYTTGRGLDIVAFGASAISSVGRVYAQDLKEVPDYQAKVAAGELPLERGYVLDDDDLIRRELLLELFCNFHVDLKAIEAQFDIDTAQYFAEDFEKLKPLAADGLLSWDTESIDVTELGRFFIRNICMTFDKHLENDPSRRMYSKTI